MEEGYIYGLESGPPGGFHPLPPSRNSLLARKLLVAPSRSGLLVTYHFTITGGVILAALLAPCSTLLASRSSSSSYPPPASSATGRPEPTRSTPVATPAAF